MSYEVGDKFVMTHDAGQSRVYISEAQTYSTMPDDYWFRYEDDETNRPLVHPDTSLLVHGDFVLPVGLIARVMKQVTSAKNDESDSEFETAMQACVAMNFKADNRSEAVNTYRKLYSLMKMRGDSEEEIINELFNKE